MFQDLIKEAAKIVIKEGYGSLSQIQRQLKLGYRAASKLMDGLEELGVVGPHNGAKPRKLLIDNINLIVFE